MSCKKNQCNEAAKAGQRLCAAHFDEACAKAKTKIASTVEKPNGETGCWTWVGATQQSGYGYVSSYELTPNSKPAYWLSLFVHDPGAFDINSHGEVHHTCKNVACVNPAHLVHLKVEMHELLHQLSNPKIAHLALEHILEAFPDAAVEVAALRAKMGARAET